MKLGQRSNCRSSDHMKVSNFDVGDVLTMFLFSPLRPALDKTALIETTITHNTDLSTSTSLPIKTKDRNGSFPTRKSLAQWETKDVSFRHHWESILCLEGGGLLPVLHRPRIRIRPVSSGPMATQKNKCHSIRDTFQNGASVNKP